MAFSYFRFDYPNGMDDKLRSAYEKMRELNKEAPRKKYLKERKKLQRSRLNPAVAICRLFKARDKAACRVKCLHLYKRARIHLGNNTKHGYCSGQSPYS